MKAECWRVKNLGDKPRHSWQETAVKWMKEQHHRKRLDDDKSYLRWLNPYLQDKYLDEINKAMIEQLKDEKLKTGASHSTVNHILSFLRAILNKARHEWDWLDTVPTIKMLPVQNNRVRWLTHTEVDRLMKELPEHLEAMARFSLATGLRESNVTGLQWTQLDMKRRCAWIPAEQSKSGKAIAVPLNNEACSIIRSQIGKHESHVFTYKGEPVTRANNHAWRKALVRAGIDNFRWHDLRHTWASWHVQNGTPLHILKELGGWADLTMVLRYAHLTSEHLAEYAGKISILGTNLAQDENRYLRK